jgi:hypothetical protein
MTTPAEQQEQMRQEFEKRFVLQENDRDRTDSTSDAPYKKPHMQLRWEGWQGRDAAANARIREMLEDVRTIYSSFVRNDSGLGQPYWCFQSTVRHRVAPEVALALDRIEPALCAPSQEGSDHE